MKRPDFLIFEHQNTQGGRILLYMLLAYLFGMGIRLLLWYQVADISSYWLDGRPLPIYSPDAGLYGYYAKQLFAGVHYPMDAEHAPGYLIYWIVAIFNLNIDWAMFLLPAFLAPLIAIPTVLMGHALGRATWGFFAALIAVSGVNYYTRSYVGYMDTDVLNLFLPYMAVASMMMALTRRSWIWGIGFFLFLTAFYGWYHSSLAIIGVLAGMALLIAQIVLRHRLALLIAIVIVAGGAFSVDMDRLGKRAGEYLSKSEMIEIEGIARTYHFANTLQTVAEAQKTELFAINENFTAMTPYVLLGTLGFILLAIAEPATLLALPLLSLAYLASLAGLRFTMFSTPVLALGFIGFFGVIANIGKQYRMMVWLPFFGLTAGLGIMLFNIFRLNPSFMPNYFLNDDVKVLREFAKKSDSKDLLVSWWDYGWPLWYYTGRNNTLVDNGRHGPDTHLTAKILLAGNDVFAANALRYFSEKQHGGGEILRPLSRHEDIARRIEDLELLRPVELNATRDVYVLLHRDMLLTYATFENFANIDISTGKKSAEHASFYLSSLLRPYSKEEPIVHGDTFDFDLRSGLIRGHDGVATQVQSVIIVEDGSIKAAKRYNPRMEMTLIIYNHTKAIYLDSRAMGTFLIRALLFDQYDKNRLEKVAQTERLKLFKLR